LLDGATLLWMIDRSIALASGSVALLFHLSRIFQARMWGFRGTTFPLSSRLSTKN